MPVPDDTPIPEGHKRCKDCGEVKPLSEYYFYKRGSKFDPRCKPCYQINAKNREPRPIYEIPEGFKRCTGGDKCDHPEGPILPATSQFFYQQKDGKYGLSSECKRCEKTRKDRNKAANPEKERKRQKLYHAANIEKEREYDKWYYATHREQELERGKRRRIENPEQGRNRKRRWRLNFPERATASGRRYRSANPERGRQGTHRYRARKYALPRTFTDKDWAHALEHFHGGCAYCGNPPSLFDACPVLHQDHYVPTIKGGGYTPDNIIPSCRRCNQEKAGKTAHDWLVGRFGKQKAKQIEARIAAYFEWVKRYADK